MTLMADVVAETREASPIDNCPCQAHKHKGLLSPTLTLIHDNEFIYVGLSCPSAWRNKIKFGHQQTAHHGRTPEDSVCELRVAALVRYTQEGQEDIWSLVV